MPIMEDESLLSPSDHLLLAQLDSQKQSPSSTVHTDSTAPHSAIQVHHHHHHHFHMDDRNHSPEVASSGGGSTSSTNPGVNANASAALKASSNNPLTAIPTDFDLDFIPSEIASLGESTAFPPSASHFPPPTPLHRAVNSSGADSASTGNNHPKPGQKHLHDPTNFSDEMLTFISPILPGQNEKSFNDQHLYHRQQQQQQLMNLSKMSPVAFQQRPATGARHGSSSSASDFYHQPSSQHVRPDVIFTPLVSPAATPLENASTSNKVPLTSFEPLTSPALNAISHDQATLSQSSSSKRRSSSSFYAPQKDSSLPHPLSKRRTPHSTPTLAAHRTNSSSALNNSPKITGIGSGVSTGAGSSSVSLTSSTNPAGSPILKREQIYPQFDRLPDSSVNDDKEDVAAITSGSSTPRLMGFTMGKLAQDKASTTNGSVNANNYNSLSRTSSTSSTSTGTSLSPTFKGGRPRKLVLKTSPIVGADMDDMSKVEGGGTTKKTSHKLAEQVRRNRMNMAVHELGRLIPQSYHDQVTIPSKATTVELGSKYIRDLLAQIEHLQLQLDDA